MIISSYIAKIVHILASISMFTFVYICVGIYIQKLSSPPHIYIYTYIYVHACVCVCVCMLTPVQASIFFG